MIHSIKNKTILITGASGGLGEYAARMLASYGANIVLGARRLESCESIAQNLIDDGLQAEAYRLDVTNEGSVQEVIMGLPALDIVINNAGISLFGATDELSLEDWKQVMDTNINGAWLVARTAIQRWKKHNQPGNIINIASIVGKRVARQLPVYASSKAALIQLTKSIALDFARNEIRCNALCPGYFSTPLNQDYMASEAGKKQIARIPMQRMGRLEELEGPLVLLCSDASSYMTGSTLVVDGGHLNSAL